MGQDLFPASFFVFQNFVGRIYKVEKLCFSFYYRLLFPFTSSRRIFIRLRGASEKFSSKPPSCQLFHGISERVEPYRYSHRDFY